MGYTTTFEGRFVLDKPLTEGHAAYLTLFSKTRRMVRDAEKCAAMPDPVRIAACLPVGDGGCYFTGGLGFMGQDSDPSVVDSNQEHHTQPSLWCKWRPTEDRVGIEWDEGEKFYDYAQWLQYLMDHFFTPWGYRLSGSVVYQGERFDDRGRVKINTLRNRVRKTKFAPRAWGSLGEEDRDAVFEALREAAYECRNSGKTMMFASAIRLLESV